MPSLSNLHLSFEEKKLEVTATDLEVTVTYRVELMNSEGSGSVLVNAKRFQELIRELPDTQLEMEIKEAGKVVLRGEGVGEYILPGGNPMEFPEMPVVDVGSNFEIPADSLKRMIERTIFAASTDILRPVLTGILMQIRPGNLCLVTTDSHRLSRISRSDVEYTGEPIEVIAPTKALGILMRNLDDDDKPKVCLAPTRASFNTDKQVLITRLIDGSYPRYESVIPSSNPNRLVAKVDELVSVARRVSIFASQISKQVKLSIDGGTLKLETEDPEQGGKAVESMSVNYSGEPLTIAYNVSYLLDVIRQIDTEEIIFELSGPDDAALIKPTTQQENEEQIMLLMPIRLH